MAEIVLNVDVRQSTGTGNARAARKAGLVPGVLYGGDQAPVAITVPAKDFRKALYTGKLLGHLVTLKYGNETQPVIAKSVDMHPITDQPIHFDLYRVDEHQQIKIEVPVHFAHQDECPGLKRGGTLNVALHTVTVSCTADHIPEEIVVDLTGLEIGATIRVSDLKIPQGATAVLDGDAPVASVAGAMAEAAEEAPAAEGEEGAAPEAEEAAEGGEA